MNEINFSSSINHLKRKNDGEINTASGKKARLDELATLAALEALAGSHVEEPTEDQILDKLEKFPETYATLSLETIEPISFNVKACSKNGLCLQYMDSFYQNK